MSKRWWHDWNARVTAAVPELGPVLNGLVGTFRDMAEAKGLLNDRPVTSIQLLDADAGSSDSPRTVGGPFDRRPVLGLTLRVVNGKVVLRPGWDARKKWIDTRDLAGDVWLPDPETEQPHRAWSFVWANGRMGRHRFCPPQADAALATLLQLPRDWRQNPGAVLARSTDHCCVCGRVLTDPVSRGRGIGPECSKQFAEQLGPLMAWAAEAIDRNGRCASAAKLNPHRPGKPRRSVCAPAAMPFPYIADRLSKGEEPCGFPLCLNRGHAALAQAGRDRDRAALLAGNRLCAG
jgi:hypothetical protein